MSVAKRNNHIQVKYKMHMINSSAQKCQLIHTVYLVPYLRIIRFNLR